MKKLILITILNIYNLTVAMDTQQTKRTIYKVEAYFMHEDLDHKFCLGNNNSIYGTSFTIKPVMNHINLYKIRVKKDKQKDKIYLLRAEDPIIQNYFRNYSPPKSLDMLTNKESDNTPKVIRIKISSEKED